MKTITPKEAYDIIESGEAVFIDVRTSSEFHDGHIHNAKNVDIYDSNFSDEIKKFDPKGTYVVNCQSGGRSSRACAVLEDLGFDHAVNLEGGISAWKGAGFPVEAN